jgi:flagellar hook capping protein FlgD
MRKRVLALGAILGLTIGVLTAAPAAAAYAVTIAFPGGHSEFYSPFDGPATITFTFDGSENDATFSLRLRRPGGTAIHTETTFVDADAPSGTKVVQFDWPALTVSGPRTYEVVVKGGGIVQTESFLLRPRLVTITGANPNPFFPWIDDGYRDTTNIRFNLSADVAAAEARIHRPNSAGKCCGTVVRNDSLGSLSAGVNTWTWNGENDTGQTLGKGSYYARIWADDGVVAPALSKAFKVSIARTYRARTTRSKPGTAYHHTTESALVRGGDCFLHEPGGSLEVDCHGAKMTVFYRWGLGSAERIEQHAFVIDNPNNECGPSKRSTAHSSHESSITVIDNVSGITSCYVVTAKITYSFPKAS